MGRLLQKKCFVCKEEQNNDFNDISYLRENIERLERNYKSFSGIFSDVGFLF
jgi:hypothetical protein